MKKLLLILILPLQLLAQNYTGAEVTRWQQQAQQITIIRDHWGIPHIYGKTDADAVFGLLYAQCEDDFKRVEINYIEKLGRMAEVKGESELYNDLFIKLVIDSAGAVADYKKSPSWLQKLLNAFADGINYYLYKNPQAKPVLLNRFQPWFPLLWTDGSIGAFSTGDVTATDLKSLYSGNNTPLGIVQDKQESKIVTGSNGFAFSPSITASGNAILYINPHVTFYFRPEVHVVSEQGLNVYGAVTWGQFFIYQGFNEHCGWMHTSSDVDVADMYAEKIVKTNNKLFYEYNKTLKPVQQQSIKLNYRKHDGLQTRAITTYFTHHGPVMAKRNGKWISVKANNRSLRGLIQSWQRTKATGFNAYKKVMELRANTSNNTVYADKEGNIAYWHGNYIPIRDTKYDWSKPVDGSITATEWKGVHTVNESVHVYNPANGWLQNCNSTPFTVAGNNSPKKENYPKYMGPDGENYRGINAVRVLSKQQAYTIDKVIAVGYDTYLSAFEDLIPALVKAFTHRDLSGEKKIKDDSVYIQLAEPVSTLKNWDLRCGENSIATTLAVEWGQRLLPAINRVDTTNEDVDQVARTKQFAATATQQQLIQPLLATINDLKNKYGTWQIAWGEINRFQRISGDIDQKYMDNHPSLPVGFASSQWGMLPSYNSRYYAGTKKRYGVNGNSFICAVEFGKKIKAKSLLAGGESGDPTSKHFNDQALMYTKGQFKDVLFYKDDVLKNAERTYHPGEIGNRN